MLRVRLSSVITGWGGNDTTRSRKSTRARIRSMNGTNNVSCPLTVRLYRPSRSITAASACGINATDLATTMIAKITRTASNTKPATAPSTGVPFSRSVFAASVPVGYSCLSTIAVAPSMCTTVTDSPGS